VLSVYYVIHGLFNLSQHPNLSIHGFHDWATVSMPGL
jgi:hypothetical protein